LILLIFFLFIGASLFSSLFFLGRRNPRRPEGISGTLVEASQALSTLKLGLLPRELVARIFAKGDFEYVASSAPRSVQEFFLDERKRVALCWVNQVRTQILSLRRFHRGSARAYARLSVKTELNLALSFASLLLACRALQVVLYARGPYAAPRMIGAMAGTAARVCRISEESLAFLNSARMAPLSDRPTGAASL